MQAKKRLFLEFNIFQAHPWITIVRSEQNAKKSGENIEITEIKTEQVLPKEKDLEIPSGIDELQKCTF